MKKVYTLKFRGSRGNTRTIAKIHDSNENGNQKTVQEIMQEANLLIRAFCAERNFTIYYSRTWNDDGMTIFDVGSHTEFFQLIPEVNFSGT